MADFAQLVLRLTGSDSPVEYLPLPVDDPTRRCPVITRARQVLGWQPQVLVEDGIARTVEWFRSRPEELRMARDGRVAGSR